MKASNKNDLKLKLKEAAEKAAKQAGFDIHKVNEQSVGYLATYNGKQTTVGIQTSSDHAISYRYQNGSWKTLPLLDTIFIATVDDKHNPTEAIVHMLNGDKVRDHFQRALTARKDAGYSLDHATFLDLYLKETNAPTSIGNGLVDETTPTFSFPLNEDEPKDFKIADAKRLLAESYGVNQNQIEITIRA
jgi:Lhr-like helicase